MIELAHIHPMLVHFPLVLLPVAAIMAWWIVLRGGDLAAHRCLPQIALTALVLGTLAGIVAAVFGDIALDKALERGFQKPPLEEHEELAFSTLAVFGVIALIQLGAWWRGLSFRGGRGWTLAVALLAASALLIDTAYHGGELIYGLGVNVTKVIQAAP